MAKTFGTFKTEKGTELPLLDLRGKAYLQVAHRLVWFREKYPTGILKTAMLHDQNDEATFKAEVFIVDATSGQPMLVATGHKSENKKAFSDYREKAETGAIGRALALAGIGTQFCEVDLEENDRLADAPVTPAKRTKGGSLRSKKTETTTTETIGDDI